MRWIIVCGLLAAPLIAGDETGDKEKKKEIPALLRPDPKLRLPESARAKADEGGYGVVVNLDAEGRLAAGDKRCSLHQLGEAIAEQVEVKKEMDGPASTMRVLLRLDRDAPWVQAQWLMVECAMRKVNRVEIAARRAGGTPGYFRCWLPVDQGVGLQAPKAETLRIDVVARAEKAALYGGRQVNKPTSCIFRIENSQFGNPEDLAKYLTVHRKKAQMQRHKFRYEVRAGQKVPLGSVVAVLDACDRAGIENVEFFGAAVPKRADRVAASLPYPEKNYEVR